MTSTPYFVVECSQVSTPAEFWKHYIEQIEPEGAHVFGRNLDAFRDALFVDGPQPNSPALPYPNPLTSPRQTSLRAPISKWQSPLDASACAQPKSHKTAR